ncbi:MAG TPA: alpha-L-rhamnosidase C-terminal domain-containing protein [Terracidiphilus sp.]|nr:alpha-L-rhamnosidase C-terminal domain-containing protein [Terracidiphilus sp.]
MHRIAGLVSLTFLVAVSVPVSAQMGNPANGPTRIPDAQLDPALNLPSSQLESALHQPLPEQYIWTHQAGSPQRHEGLAPQYFRRTFQVTRVPGQATLYLAGPRQAAIYLNGKEVGHYQLNLDFPMGIRVYELGVSGLLRAGKNVLAIEAVRGPGAGNEAGDPVSRDLSQGEVLAAMIVPAARGRQADPLVMSDAQWKASAQAPPAGWQDAGFDDANWPGVDDEGGIESSIDLFQANADAGMYAWPGYDGISPFLAHYPLNAVKVDRVYGGLGTVANAQALTGDASAGELTVTLPEEQVSYHNAPQVLLDFGREVNGRLELQSDSDAPAAVTVQYGESEGEAISEPYLGVDPVYLPPHGTAYGPKSAFRYAIVRFTAGRAAAFHTIRLDGIAYPVTYRGSFESSDPELNKMWTVGAYTAHLCMQDDIWDAPKRDRNRWMGDLDVSGQTIDDVFGDRFLMEDTLNRLLGPPPVERHVNEIPGYSAFWLMGEKDYYLHTGSMKQLESVHTRLVQLLDYMKKDLNDQDLFSDLSHAWPFVDWSPGMNSDDAQTRMATQFEYYAAFKDGAYLLNILHDETNARRMEEEADALKTAAQRSMLDSQGSFGNRWQPNAFAVISGVANKDQYAAIWHNALSDVGHVEYNPYIITPYYNFYVVTAMAEMGHREAALNWIRQYWGGMVDEGATSYWEGYDPSWYKGSGFHQSLQADNMSGFAVSLAHGWSSGVTPWLMTQVLGIQPTAGGFAKVEIRPDLLGLQWAKGGEPTPHGMLKVSIRDRNGYQTTIDLPAGVQAQVSVPVPTPGAQVTVNGKPAASTPAEEGKRAEVTLSEEGEYVIAAD